LNNTPPCYLYLFDTESTLFGFYEFHIHKPNNKDSEVNFHKFLASLSNDIFKNCVYEAMKKNAYTNDYKFYMHISSKNLLEKKVDKMY
jgi:hypothetical protein